MQPDAEGTPRSSDASDRIDAAVERMWKDYSDGRLQDLESYLAEYPGIEEQVAREYRAIREVLSGRDGGRRDGGEDDAGELGRLRDAAFRGPGSDDLETIAGVGGGAELHWPERVGRYELLERIGKGGMGVVFLAYDSVLRRDVVVKSILPELAAEPDVLERFRTEAHAASKLDGHPGICSALDFIEEDGRHYVVLRHIEGVPLDRILKAASAEGDDTSRPGDRFVSALDEVTPTHGASDRPTSSGVRGRRASMVRAAELIGQLAEAIEHAHSNGIVHRDLKPGNVMVRPDGQGVVLDFGLAIDADADGARLTREGHVLGTPAYMSPEQVLGQIDRIGPRTDVYALGVMLYELLCMKRPFASSDRRLVMDRVLEGNPTPPRRIDPTIPEDLEAVCMKAMASDIERRYPSAAELARDLERFCRFEPVLAARVTRLGRFARRARRHPVTTSAIAIAVVLAVGFVLQGLLFADRVDDAKTETHRDERALFEVHAALLRGEAPPAAEEARLRSVVGDDVFEAYRRNPGCEDSLDVIRARIDEARRSRGGEDSNRLLRPRLGVMTLEPAFEFRPFPGQAAGVVYSISVLDVDSLEESGPFPVSPEDFVPQGGDDVRRLECPDSLSLEPDRVYLWTLEARDARGRSLKTASAAFATVAPETRAAALSSIRPDLTPELARLARAARLLDLDLMDAVAAELEISTEGWEPSSRDTKDVFTLHLAAELARLGSADED